MLLLPLLLTLACTDPSPTTSTHVDGVLCVEGEVATVEFDLCLSSSCDTLVSAECTVTAEGDTLTVTAEAVVRSLGEVCTDDCGRAEASCDLPAGSDPATMVVWGAESLPLETMQAGTCLGE